MTVLQKYVCVLIWSLWFFFFLWCSENPRTRKRNMNLLYQLELGKRRRRQRDQMLPANCPWVMTRSQVPGAVCVHLRGLRMARREAAWGWGARPVTVAFSRLEWKLYFSFNAIQRIKLCLTSRKSINFLQISSFSRVLEYKVRVENTGWAWSP